MIGSTETNKSKNQMTKKTIRNTNDILCILKSNVSYTRSHSWKGID